MAIIFRGMDITNPKMQQDPSPLQGAIFNATLDRRDSILVKATAGSGKTSVIVTIPRLVPSQSCGFFAFNKTIVTELQSLLPPNTTAATFNSIGHNVWIKSHRNYQLLKGKSEKTHLCFDIWLEKHIEKVSGDDTMRNGIREAYCSFVCKLVDMLRSEGIAPEKCGTKKLVRLAPDSFENLAKIVDHHEIELGTEGATVEAGIAITRKVLAISIDLGFNGIKSEKLTCGSLIDYNDQLYLPFIAGMVFSTFDNVLIDEAQDSSPIRIAIVRRMIRKGGRSVWVGDSSQAINAFAGAGLTAMQDIKKDFNCIEMPLNVSYRCAKNIVKFAQQWDPSIQPAPTAPEGVVGTLSKYNATTFQRGDMILCRNTAPLVVMAFQLLARKVACQIAGRDIATSLLTLIKKMKAKNIPELLEKLTEYKEREVASYLSLGKEDKAQVIEDKVDAIIAVVEALSEDERTIEGLKESIDAIFEKEENGSKSNMVTLSSVHKSKGAESKRVFGLDRIALMPSKYARQQWMLEQEYNLLFVLATRAKMEYYDIQSGCWE